MFTVNVVISATHTLKTSGLYKVVRHPSYLGLLLIIIGLGISLDSLLSVVVMIVPSFIALNYRISIEEQALVEEFGQQYTDYKKRVKKWYWGSIKRHFQRDASMRLYILISYHPLRRQYQQIS